MLAAGESPPGYIAKREKPKPERQRADGPVVHEI